MYVCVGGSVCLSVCPSICLSVCERIFFSAFILFSFLCVFPFHTSFYVLHVSVCCCVAAVRIFCPCLPACCIVFPLEGENFSTAAAAASAPIANIVLKAAITVPLRSLAPPAKQQQQQAASPKALDICIRSAPNRTHFVTRCRHLDL